MKYRYLKIFIFNGVLVFLMLLISCTSPKTCHNYYFDSANGGDQNPGTSPDKPFKSLHMLQELNLQPGDSVLLKAGEVFHDSLYISCKGAPGKPIVLGKYGGDIRPHIQGDASVLQMVHVFNSEYVVIRDLEISNKGAEIRPHLSGLLIELKNYGVARQIVVDNLFIHDVFGSLFKGDGYQHKDAGGGQAILLKNLQGNEPDSIASCFDSLLVQNCYIKNCQRNGIMMWGNWIRKYWFPSSHVIIRNNLLEGVPGDGIVPVGCEAPLVEYNVMRNCPATLPPTEACDGIWPWSCDNALIQYNVVCDHHSQVDGYGFDSDYNCTNSVFQYNLSCNNEGGFLLLCNSGGWPTDWSIGNRGTIVRYNISINDGLRNFKVKEKYFSPVIHCTGPVKNSIIEKNLFYLVRKTDKNIDRTLISLDDWRGYPDSTVFRNNFIYTEEPYHGALIGNATHSVFENNQVVGSIKQSGFCLYSDSFNKEMWYTSGNPNWDKLIDFVSDKTIVIHGKECKVTDLIGVKE